MRLPIRCNHPLKKCSSGESMKMMDMRSGHDQAAMSHEMMQNVAILPPIRTWLKCIKNDESQNLRTPKKLLLSHFPEMSEHEKAAVVHEKANNGQSSVIHQQQAGKAIAARSPRINPQLQLVRPSFDAEVTGLRSRPGRFISEMNNNERVHNNNVFGFSRPHN